MKLLNLGISETFFDAHAASTANSETCALPVRATQLTWQTSFGSAPASITIQLQTSLDNSIWSTVDSSTSTTGETKSLATSALFVRFRINAVSGGSGITVKAVCKTGVIGAGDATLDNLTVLGNLTVDGGASIVGNLTADGAIFNSLVAAGLTYPVADGTNGQVLSTDGSGNLSWITPSSGGSPPFTIANNANLALNAGSAAIISADSGGNVLLQGRDGTDPNAQVRFGASGGSLEIVDGTGAGIRVTSTSINAIGPNPDQLLQLRSKGNLDVQSVTPFTAASSGIAAFLTTSLGVSNADLTWTATAVGQGGNNLQVAYADGVALSAAYVAPVLTITINTGVTTANDIIALGSYDSFPGSPSLAPGNDGSGIVIAMSAQSLSGGLSALNVTGPSWLDNGNIFTDGSGNISIVGLLIPALACPSGQSSAVTLSVDDTGLITFTKTGCA